MTDFGLSANINEFKYDKSNDSQFFFYFNSTQRSNSAPAYLDPYVYEGVTSKADAWSLAVILFQLVCGKLPFGTMNNPVEMTKYV